MSAIGGIFHLDGKPVERSSLAGMSESVKFRGPDRQKAWFSGSIGLFNNLLVTIPESIHENMPFEAGNFVVTADLRIDNRDDLIRNLGIRRNPAEIPDSLIILEAFLKWNEDCPQHLTGDFAFAIWDKKNKNLFCARDHLGVKPFYYCFLPNNIFVFSSELKALFKSGLVKREIKEIKIFDFLREYEAINKTSTSYENVEKLHPGHFFRIFSESLKDKSYWAFNLDKEIRYKKQDDYNEHFLELFTEAVRCRLRSTKQTASMLSGGVDSSAIVCVARDILKNTGQQLSTISAIAGDGSDCPEKPYIDSVVNEGSLNTEFIRSDRIESYKSGLEYIFDNIEEPYDFTMNWIAIVNLKAKETGCNFILDGVDGDIATNQGPEVISYLYKNGKIFDALFYTYSMAAFYEQSFLKYLWDYGIKSNAPDIARKIWKRFSRDEDYKIRKPGFEYINENFYREYNRKSPYHHDINLTGLKNSSDNIKLEHLVRINSPYITVAFERYDRLASLCSLESRHPLFDIRLLDFCLAIPYDQKFKNGLSKGILRESMKAIVPEIILKRKSFEHVGLNFQTSTNKLFEVEIKDSISSKNSTISHFIDIESVNNIFEKNKKGEKIEGMQIWMTWYAYALNKWIENTNLE